MSQETKSGVCNICWAIGPLSYEHVPPASAFNNSKVLLATADSYWNNGPGRGLRARGKQFQRGYGSYSICRRCNSDTGRWYAPFFTDWCRHGLTVFDQAGGAPALHYFTPIFPLPVLKQIVTIFLARSGQYFGWKQRESLARFVLNKEQRYLDPEFRFWVYLVAPGPLRDAPLCGQLNTVSGHLTLGTEFSFPPYGYMMTLGSHPEDPRLQEITWFSRFGYFDLVQIALRLELLPTHTPVLGDYRSFRDMSHDRHGPRVFTKLGIKGVDL